MATTSDIEKAAEVLRAGGLVADTRSRWRGLVVARQAHLHARR
ncbi:hypothetical protein [Streptomyces sp. NPDC003015]